MFYEVLRTFRQVEAIWQICQFKNNYELFIGVYQLRISSISEVEDVRNNFREETMAIRAFIEKVC